MSRTLLSDLPQIVADKIKVLLPDLRECNAHAGKFSLAELKRKGIPAPAVLVSVLGAKQDTTYAGQAHTFMMQMAAYVVTKDGRNGPRDIHAANICQSILSLVPDQTWGQPALGQARDTGLHTLVSEKTKDHAVSLWAVTWSQPVSFFDREQKPLGVELYVGQSPATGNDHVADYSQIGGPSS